MHRPKHINRRTVIAGTTAGIIAPFAAMAQQYPGVYVEETRAAKPIVQAETSIAAFIGPADRTAGPVRLTRARALARQFGREFAQSITGLSIRSFFANGGRQAIVATSRGDTNRQTLERSLDALSNDTTAHFNMLCIPAAHQAIPDSNTDLNALYTAALDLCRDRKAMLLGDVPDLPQSAVQVWHSELTLDDPNAAFYYPHLSLTRPAAGGPAALPPSGAVAGVYARTDTTRGVWKAPAGIDATLVGGAPTQSLTDAWVDTLAELNINSIRTLPATGPIVWGARTLSESEPDYRYVPVRRTALMIEESLLTDLTWVVFEPNDEPLWDAVRASVETFMMTLFRQGAFPASKAQEAFFVRCGTDTITQSDREQGILRLIVGFAPLQPAEFVMMPLSWRVQQP